MLKIIHDKSPSYLFELIPNINNCYATGSAQNNQIPFLSAKTSYFKNQFFAVIAERNNLDVSIRNSTSCSVLRTQ